LKITGIHSDGLTTGPQTMLVKNPVDARD
jgi:hypothetical protein